jgi:uncharacterized protein YcbK (DUF882 family)
MVLRWGFLLFLVCLLLVPVEARAGKKATKNLRGRAVKKTYKNKIKRGKTSSSTRIREKRRVRRRCRDYWPPMKLAHVNTREKLTIRLYDRRGRTIRASVRRLDRFLRCHYTNKHRRMHWRLIQRLYRISRRFKGKVIRVYSGYRSRKVSRSRTSRHTVGRAIDFAVRGVSTRKLRDYILTTYKTKRGLGYYPNTPFVHFDVREKSAFWVDYSGKGEEPRYSTNPFAVLRQEQKKERTARRKNRTARRRVVKTVVATAKPVRRHLEPMGPLVPPMGPPAPRTGRPTTPKAAPIEPMGPPRPPEPDDSRAAVGPPPVGEGPTPDGKPAPKPKASPEDEAPGKRATTKGSPAMPPSQPPAKDTGGPVSNVRGAPP